MTFVLQLVAVAALFAPAPVLAMDIAGTWEATEFDPLLGENAFFGQFRYRMEITREGALYTVTVSRTGSRFAPAPLQGNRLVTEGTDATRGPAALDLTFAGDRFEGTIAFDGDERRIEGILTPGSRLSTAESAARSAEAEVASVTAESNALRAEVTALRQQVDALTARLERETDARRDAEAQLDAANRRIAGLERRAAASAEEAPPAPASVPAPTPTPGLIPPAPPTRPAASSAALPTGAPRLELIEPPYDPDNGQDIVTHDLPVTHLIGRARSPVGLLSLRLNGQELETDARGLFTVPVTIEPTGTPIRLVAVDRDGRRTALNLTLRPPAKAKAPGVPAADSAGERCYQLGIAAEKVGEAALEACRQAVEEAPETALNHYNLAVTLSRLGRHQEAIRSYQEAAGRWVR